MATEERNTDDEETYTKVEKTFTKITLLESGTGRRTIKPGEHGDTMYPRGDELVDENVYAIVPLDSPTTWGEIMDGGVDDLPKAAREFLGDGD